MNTLELLTPFWIKWGILTALWLELILASILMLLQVWYINVNTITPTILKKFGFEEKHWEQSRTYMKEFMWLRFTMKARDVVFWMGLIFLDIFHFAWEMSENLLCSHLDVTPSFFNKELRRNLSYSIIQALFIAIAIRIPDQLLMIQLKKKHGLLPHMPFKHFLDRYLSISLLEIVQVVFMDVILTAFIQSMNYLISSWIIKFLMLYVGFSVFIAVYFAVALRIRFKDTDRSTFIPIPPGELKDKIDELCERTGFAKENVYIMKTLPGQDANAFCISLFGITRIVLHSSIIKGFGINGTYAPNYGLTLRELAGVIMHEMGHWKYYHSEITYFVVGVIVFPVMYATGFWLTSQQTILEAFGFAAEKLTPFPILPAFMMANALVLRGPFMIASSLINLLSQGNEYEADEFAVKESYSVNLQEGLVKLSIDHRIYPAGHRLYSALYWSHPTILQRVSNINYKAFGK